MAIFLKWPSVTNLTRIVHLGSTKFEVLTNDDHLNPKDDMVYQNSHLIYVYTMLYIYITPLEDGTKATAKNRRDLYFYIILKKMKLQSSTYTRRLIKPYPILIHFT